MGRIHYLALILLPEKSRLVGSLLWSLSLFSRRSFLFAIYCVCIWTRQWTLFPLRVLTACLASSLLMQVWKNAGFFHILRNPSLTWGWEVTCQYNFHNNFVVFFLRLRLVKSTGQFLHLQSLETFHCPWATCSFLEFGRCYSRGALSLSSPCAVLFRSKDLQGRTFNRLTDFNNRLDGHTIDAVLARKLKFNGLLFSKGILHFIFYHLKMKIRPWTSQNYLNFDII